jgi:hypothetical protein
VFILLYNFDVRVGLAVAIPHQEVRGHRRGLASFGRLVDGAGVGRLAAIFVARHEHAGYVDAWCRIGPDGQVTDSGFLLDARGIENAYPDRITAGLTGVSEAKQEQVNLLFIPGPLNWASPVSLVAV